MSYEKLLEKNVEVYNGFHETITKINYYYFLVSSVDISAIWIVYTFNKINFIEKCLFLVVIHWIFTIAIYLLAHFSVSYGFLRRRVEKSIFEILRKLNKEKKDLKKIWIFNPCEEVNNIIDLIPDSNFTHMKASFILWLLSMIVTSTLIYNMQPQKIEIKSNATIYCCYPSDIDLNNLCTHKIEKNESNSNLFSTYPALKRNAYFFIILSISIPIKFLCYIYEKISKFYQRCEEDIKISVGTCILDMLFWCIFLAIFIPLINIVITFW